MLTEFALTPEVFDPACGGPDREQWREHIREFARGAYPDHQVASLLVSNLYGGEWKKRFRALVSSAQDADKELLQSIEPKLARSLVFRPAFGQTPSQESHWITHAGYSSQRLPIDRVVYSSALANPPGICCRVQPVHDSSRRDFWDCLGPQRDPQMDLAEQVRELTPLVTRFPLIAFASPHLHVGDGKDAAFALALIKAACQRPQGFPGPVRIDLFTHAPSLKDAAAVAIADYVERHARPRPILRLACLPKFVERVLMLGELDGDDADIRWGAHLGHVVRPALDGPGADPTTWTILRQKTCAHWSDNLYGKNHAYHSLQAVQ